jgi:hypothetical protein
LGDRSVGSYLLRLALPALLTLIAFPSFALHRTDDAISISGVVSLAVVCAAGLALVVTRAAPAADEPDLHDRQVDVILALPLLGVAGWLALGWPGTSIATEPLGNRGVVALTVYFAGASLLLLGTRLTARLRWVLCLPLLGLPWLAAQRELCALIIALVAVRAGLAVLRHSRPHRLGQPRLGSRLSGRWQQLPPLDPAAVLVGTIAVALGGLALAGDGSAFAA